MILHKYEKNINNECIVDVLLPVQRCFKARTLLNVRFMTRWLVLTKFFLLIKQETDIDSVQFKLPH